LGLHLLLPVQAENEVQPVIRPGHPDLDTLGRPAIGAVARVYLPNGQQRVGLVDGGNGQAGVRSSDLHFGLGQLAPDTPLSVELHWRDTNGQVQQETVELSPGWHTILLGQLNETVASR
jgi:hypothetical protein